MRVELKKFLFAGHEKDKAEFFTQAQKLGIIDFIGIKNVRHSSEAGVAALKVLRGLESSLQEEPSESIIEPILHLKKEVDRLEEEARKLAREAEKIEPFGYFSRDDLNGTGLKAQFFISKSETDLIPISCIDGFYYYLSLSKDPVSRPDLAEVIIERPFTELKEKEALCRERLREAQHELQSYAKYSHALHRDILKQLDSFDRSQAVDSADAPMGGLFSAQAWVPENKVMLLETLPAAAMEIAIEDGDRVPTYLDNEKWNRVGEDVIGIYDTPSASDKDPSLWVLASFAVFFAFIVGDGGYGAIYLALSLWVKYKNPALSGLKKRILNLAILLSSACIIWGLCTNSFFGMSLDLEHPMRKFSMVTRLAEKKAEYLIAEQNIEYAKWVAQYPGLELSSKGWDFLKNDEILGSFSDTILLELSLFFGIIHVLLGMGRYLKKNPVNIGWMIFLIGAALYFPVYLGGSSLLNYAVGIPFEKGGEIGLYMIGGGIAIAWGLSIYRNGWTGSLEIMNLIQVFADILSYLRLYALGLAGAILGSTINQMAAELPLMIGIFLAIVSHGINMVLGIMGGVIHGLRLNFLEWYHYSLEGGGKKFKPLSLNKLD